MEVTSQSSDARPHWVGYFSYLRAWGAIAIVFLHAIVSTLGDTSPDVVGFTPYVVGQAVMIPLTRWAVPVFFMVTGALLLDPAKRIGKSKLKHYIARIVVVLMSFGLLFGVTSAVIQDGLSGIDALVEGLIKVVYGETWDHLWYLYALIGIYLLVPALRIFVAHTSRQTYVHTLIVLYVMCFCVPNVNELFSLGLANLHIPAASYPVFYVLLGYFAHSSQRLTPRMMAVGILAGVVASVWGAWGELLDADVSIVFFPQSMFIAPYALMIFLAARELVERHVRSSQQLAPWILTVDKLGFGLYVVHPIFVHAFVDTVPLSWMPLWLYAFMCFVFSLTLGLVLTAVLRKIPWLGRYF
ncbi:MAG: acyltransferase [Atopobiaceae bacterium]